MILIGAKLLCNADTAKGSYLFDSQVGYPEDLQNQINEHMTSLQGLPLNINNHVNQRSIQNDNKHGVGLSDIPNINGRFPRPEHGFSPVQVEHDGNRITKMLMAGPLNDNEDVKFPVSISHNPQGPSLAVPTIWRNQKNDIHKSLDLNRVHMPEEFRQGKPPRRKLASELDTAMNGYKPTPFNSKALRQKLKEKIQKMYANA